MIAQRNPAADSSSPASAEGSAPHLPAVRSNLVAVFTQDGEFGALNAALAWLKARGFSVGPHQRGDPIGFMHGECVVAKYRNLSAEDRADLHGVIHSPTGFYRSGPVTVGIRPDAPWAAQQAFRSEPEDHAAQEKIEGRVP